MSKPLIGLTANFKEASGEQSAFSYLSAGYYDAISGAGGIPVMIPPLEDADDLHELLDRLEGLVLVGGADLDPRRDGWMLHPANRLLDPRRETFDRRVAKEAFIRRMPVFGIGAGMQLLNVTLGGNLFLHLAEDKPTALPHMDSLDPAHRHTLELVPGSLIERVYGDGELRVNSMHHMAIDEIAPGFDVTARCPDGVIETIESNTDDWFAIGTQFHPEASSASALDLRIFEEFIAGVHSAAERVSLPV